MKEQESESNLRAKASRGKLQKPHSQVKERERVKETDSGMKAKRLVAHSSEQASDESETDCENEESDSGMTAVRMEKTQKEIVQMKRRKQKLMKSPLLLPVKRK